MNENFEKLYKYLYDSGSTTLGRDEFYGIYASEPDQYEKLYGHLLNKGLTTLSSDAFYDEYFGNQKKKETSNVPQVYQPPLAKLQQQQRGITGSRVSEGQSADVIEPFSYTPKEQLFLQNVALRDATTVAGYTDRQWRDAQIGKVGGGEKAERDYLPLAAAINLPNNPAAAFAAQAVADIPIVGDYIDDLARSLAYGSTQNDAFAAAFDLMEDKKEKGRVTSENLSRYIEETKNKERFETLYGVTQETEDLFKTIEEEGNTVYGLLKGIWQNPTSAPLVSAQMFPLMLNQRSISAAAATIAAGAGVGAGVGVFAAGVGAIPGAGVGALESIPIAMGVAAGSMEKAASFGQYLNEALEARGLEFNDENISMVLNNPSIYADIYTRASKRANTIGIVSAMTSLAAGAYAAHASSAGYSKLTTGLVSAGIGTVGEGLGEGLAQVRAGDDINAAEIGLEMIGGPGEAVVTAGAEYIRNRRQKIAEPTATAKNPVIDKDNPYKINGSPVSREDLMATLNAVPAEEFSEYTFDYGDDAELREAVRDKAMKSKTLIQALQMDEFKDMDAADLKQLVDLQTRRQTLLEGATEASINTSSPLIRTQVQEIDSQIEAITSKYMTKPVQEAAQEVSDVKVRELINRPVSISSFGVSKNGTPIDGDMYLDGQTVVVDDGNTIYELGSAAEVLDKPASELGVTAQKSEVTITPEGIFNIDGKNYVSQLDLPTYGIEYDDAGRPFRVSLKEADGEQRMMIEGQKAVDAAYQILLQQAQSPQQVERVNQALEQNEEFQRDYAAAAATRDTDRVAKPRKVVPVAQRKANPVSKTGASAATASRNVRRSFKKVTQDLLTASTPQQTAKALSDYDFLINNNLTPTRQAQKVYDEVKKQFEAQGYTYNDGISIGAEYTPDMAADITELPSNNIPVGKTVVSGIVEPSVSQNGEVVQKAKVVAHTGVGKKKGGKKAMKEEDGVFIAQNKKQMQELLINLFGLPPDQAKAAAEVMHNMITVKAKRDGISVEDMYNKIAWTQREDKLNANINDNIHLFQPDLKLPSGITIRYNKNKEAFEILERDGFITRDKSITDFDGFMAVHQPDDMGALEIVDEEENVIVKGKGGMFWAVLNHGLGHVWAAGNKKAANSFAKLINDAASKTPGGHARLALTSGGKSKNLSNYLSALGIVDTIIYWSNSDKFNVSKDKVRILLNEAILMFEGKLLKKINDPKVDEAEKADMRATLDLLIKANVNPNTPIEQTRALLVEALRPPLSFGDRRLFVDAVFRGINSSIADAESVNQIIGFFRDGMENPYFKTKYQKEGKESYSVPLAALEDGFSWMLAEPYIRDISRNNKGTGYVYAVVEVERPNGMSPTEPLVRARRDDSHEAYPYLIETVNNDINVKLHILKDNMHWQEIFGNPATNDLLYSQEDPYNAAELAELNAIDKLFRDGEIKKGLTKKQKARQEYLKTASRLFPPTSGVSMVPLPIVESVRQKAIAAAQGNPVESTPIEPNYSATQTDNRAEVVDVNGNPVYFQNRRAAVLIQENKYTIFALTNPDVSSPVHEMAHIFEDSLTADERNSVLTWAGHSEWTVETSEMFASGAEKFIYEGVSADPKVKKIFQKFVDWLETIYMGIKGSPLELQLNDDMRAIYERIFNPSNLDNVTHEYGEESGAMQDRTLNQGPVNSSEWVPRNLSYFQESVISFRKFWQSSMARLLDVQDRIVASQGDLVPIEQDFRLRRDLMPQRVAYRQEAVFERLNQYAEMLKAAKLTNEDVHAYLMLAHADERDALVLSRDGIEFGSGLTPDRRVEMIEQIAGKEEAIKPIADMLYKEIKIAQSHLVDYQLESQSTIDAWNQMFSNYVPLDGIATDESNTVESLYPRGGTGLAVRGKMFKRIKGRKTEVSNIPANIFNLSAQVIAKGEKNKVMQSLAALVNNNKAPEFWEIISKPEYENKLSKDDKKKAVEFRYKGKQFYVSFKGKYGESLSRSLQNMDVVKVDKFSKLMSQLFISIIRKTTTTASPTFFIPNSIRDFQQAIIFAINESEVEGGYIFGTEFGTGDFVKATAQTAFEIFTTMKKGKMKQEYRDRYEEYVSLGGKTGFSQANNLQDVIEKIDDLLATGTAADIKKIGAKVYEYTIGVIENINERFEDSIRLATYIAAVRAGADKERAAQLAKNVTVNFNESGDFTHTMGSHYIFFNAGVQGVRNSFRLLTKLKPPVKRNGESREWYERISPGQKSLASLAALGIMITMYNLSMSDEDESGTEEYAQIDDFYKQRSIILMGGENRIQVPLSYGLSPYYNLGVIMAESAAGLRNPWEATAFMAESIITGFSPMSIATNSETLEGKIFRTVVPSYIKAGIENALNENYKGEKFLRERMPGETTPSSQLSKNAPDWMREVFKDINELTGGSVERSGAIDANPDYIWHWMESYYGGLGNTIGKTVKTGRALFEGAPVSPYDVPLMSTVYKEKSRTYHPRLYRERKLEIQQLYDEYNNPEARQPDPTKQLYRGVGTLNNEIKQVEKTMKELRRQERLVRNSMTMDYAEKQNRLTDIRDAQFRVYLLFNKMYNETRGQKED